MKTNFLSQLFRQNLILAVFFVASLLLATCSRPTDSVAFEKKIERFLSDKAGISCEERSELEQMLLDNRRLADEFGQPGQLEALVQFTVRKMNARGNNIPAEVEICSLQAAVKTEENIGESSETASHIFDFYLENSASMNGYFKGNREFKDAMLNLLTRVNGRNDRLNLFFINSQIHAIPDPLTRFINLLEPEYAAKFGDTRTSEINKILDMVAVEAVQKPEKLSVVVSDYIYSIRTKNVAEELIDHKYYTTLAMQKFVKRGDFAVLVIKFESSFSGNFYDCRNQKWDISAESGEKRPFYVWAMGKRDKITQFIKDYRITDLKGFQTFMVFQKSATSAPFYTVLLETERKGRFRAERGASGFQSLEGVAPERDGLLQMAVAVDLSQVPAHREYLLQAANYAVEPSVSGSFEVVSVQSVSAIEANDVPNKGTATHFLVLTGRDLPIGKQELRVCLRQKLPDWVEASSTMDDSSKDKRLNKTFGLLQLMEGVAGAFDLTEQSNYFLLPIQINR